MRDNIVITKADYEKLQPLVDGARAFNGSDATSVGRLAQELDRADIVDAGALPRDVITMNSRARLKDLDSGEVKEYRLIFPTQERRHNDISILAPIGTAMLGYRVGDVIEWQVPRGTRRLEVIDVIFQPEAQRVPVDG
ncbi:MAG: nucleoside diphosphate kinase regulator [Bryobacterales bacterium]|nr:nucleoside diphosphate kinase regulator [Bryobacterales bacterium]